jgi:endonuclease/exonuclease/phosphatase family metal-dependent hydrolase
MPQTSSPAPRRRLKQFLALSIAANLLALPALYFFKRPAIKADDAAAVQGGISLKITTFNTEYWHIPEQELIDHVRYQDMDVVFFQEHLEKHGDTWGSTNRIPQLKAVLKDRFVDVNGEVVTVSRWPIVYSRAFRGDDALRTDVRGPGGRVISVYNMHLPVHIHPELLRQPLRFFHDADAIASDRQQLLEEFTADLARNPNPTIVAGDFNTSSAMNGTSWFREHMTDAYAGPHCRQASDTFGMAGGALSWRIDYVFVSRHFLPAGYCTQPAPGMSDHQSITADLLLLEQAEPTGHRAATVSQVNP